MFTFDQLSVIVEALRSSIEGQYQDILECEESFRMAEDAGEPTGGVALDREYAHVAYRMMLATLHEAKDAQARLQPD